MVFRAKKFRKASTVKITEFLGNWRPMSLITMTCIYRLASFIWAMVNGKTQLTAGCTKDERRQ